MTQGPGWLDRVLTYEELTGEERTQVDALLARSPEARRLLEVVQQAERAEPVGELPEGGALAAEDVAAARSSLEALLRRALPAASRPAPRRTGWRAWLTPRVLVPTAALAVAAWLALPWSPLRPLPILEEFAAVRADGRRGADPADEAWRRGDAFVLRAELHAPSLVLLVHVDPRGRVEVLDPPAAEAPRVRPAGPLAFPEHPEEWTLDGEPGTETFLLAARSDSTDAVAVRQAVDDLRRIRPGDGSVARVRGILEARFDTVLVTRIRHDIAPPR